MFNFNKIKAYMDLYPNIEKNYLNSYHTSKYWIEFKDIKEVNEFYSLLREYNRFNGINNGSIEHLSIMKHEDKHKVYGGLYGEWCIDKNWLLNKGAIIVSSDKFKGNDTLGVIQKIENLINILENDI